MVSLGTAIALVCLFSATSAFPTPDLTDLTSLIFVKTDDNLDRFVIEVEFDDFFEDMDLDSDKKVNVTEFIQAWTALTRQSEALATAFFYLLDDDDNDFLDDVDFRAVNRLFDADGDGSIDEFEFADGFQTLFYRAPFLVLFDLADGDDLFLDELEFGTLFFPFTNQTNGAVTRALFRAGWQTFQFGNALIANLIFDEFDLDFDDVILPVEVARKFARLDTDRNGLLTPREIIALGDLLRHSKTQG